MLNTYYAGYAFTMPPADAPFGNVGRNSFRAPGFGQWDLAINKTFRVFEKITDAAFGTIRSTYPPRQIQFALKVVF